MAATLDDVVTAINNLRTAVWQLRDIITGVSSTGKIHIDFPYNSLREYEEEYLKKKENTDG